MGDENDPARAFRQSKKPVPPHIQHEVERRAHELIDSTLKPRYIQPPPKKAEINFVYQHQSGHRIGGPLLMPAGPSRGHVGSVAFGGGQSFF
jgi:hypothetical protein